MSTESKKFSKKWKSSKKPKKQRKYRLNAETHLAHKFLKVHLSKELRKKFGKRSIRAKTGDKVKVLRGKFKKHEGKIEEASLKTKKVFVSGIELTKRDGTKSKIALEPSNLMIVELNLDDQKRQKIIARK